ncbi:MAG: DNA alkylation repair protein [Rhizobiales bacterium]|nr:DNA alkylation repair protein [Hyphomicrobiales bacterium]NRB13423.1 DNA alkylation repair protein [Hyphomicrobiales bacterium]
MAADDAKLMKHSLGKVAVTKIAEKIHQVWPEFEQQKFIDAGLDGLENLELKARVNHLIASLHLYLPQDYEHTCEILMQLPDIWPTNEGDDSFSIFAIWPLIDYVGEYGLNHPEKSLDVLAALTPLFSAEFAIRPFINQHFELTYKRLLSWCEDDNAYVRRLASEGMRPRLPWGLQLKQFVKDPQPVIKLLQRLKDDEAEYVRRSVANNLNDISKDHPDLVIETCKKWLKHSHESLKKNQLWIAKRATRGLVKQGHPGVFAVLGFSQHVDVQIGQLSFKNAVIKMGDYLEFNFELNSNIEQYFVLDFAIHFMKANGKQARKVFKLKNLNMTQGEKIIINKKQIFKPISTRKYYPGQHRLEILINGASYSDRIFELEM